ncbi:MAG: flagellar basal body L-ring protein FlgH [Gemmatimonadales bacterium]|nr:flagellar basal body L-ring protein FlgH [Gemmatimonadales bacterium]
MRRMQLALGVAVLLAPGRLEAQGGTPPDSAARAPAVAVATPRQSWLSDRLPLRVGDLITIVVDESTDSRERSSNVARSTRSQEATIAGDITDADIGIGYGARSDNTGTVNRSGQLSGVLSVRVVGLEPNGLARIEGRKAVTLDGRTQELLITGVVRSEDVTAGNTIYSSRVADAVLTYKGKKIGPSTGILGKIVGLLWP